MQISSINLRVQNTEEEKIIKEGYQWKAPTALFCGIRWLLLLSRIIIFSCGLSNCKEKRHQPYARSNRSVLFLRAETEAVEARGKKIKSIYWEANNKYCDDDIIQMSHLYQMWKQHPWWWSHSMYEVEWDHSSLLLEVYLWNVKE